MRAWRTAALASGTVLVVLLSLVVPLEAIRMLTGLRPLTQMLFGFQVP